MLRNPKRRLSGPCGTGIGRWREERRKGGYDDDAVDGWTTLSRTRCIRKSRYRCVRAVRELAVVSRRYTVPSMHCSCSMHLLVLDVLLVLDAPSRVASRRPFGVGDEIAIAQDRIHIITGGKGDRAPFHTSHTVWSRHTADASPRISLRVSDESI